MMSQAALPLDDFHAVPKHPHSTAKVTYLDRARATPLLKWAGGKRAIVPDIVQHLPAHFGHYWEPFVGGGAMFFALDSRIRRATLSDCNKELILTYTMLKKQTRAVIEQLQEHQQAHSRDYYLKIRREGHTSQEATQLAARFIYLNKTCYNGLYRVNQAGQFNVPMGSYKNPTICDADNLRAAAEVLKKAKLRACSFEKIKPESGDLIYCDPPYDGTYTGYTGTGFTEEDHKALRDACQRWRKAGAHLLVSNSDTPLIRTLYHDFRLVPIAARRNINCQGDGREKVQELLICGT